MSDDDDMVSCSAIIKDKTIMDSLWTVSIQATVQLSISTVKYMAKTASAFW